MHCALLFVMCVMKRGCEDEVSLLISAHRMPVTDRVSLVVKITKVQSVNVSVFAASLPHDNAREACSLAANTGYSFSSPLPPPGGVGRETLVMNSYS